MTAPSSDSTGCSRYPWKRAERRQWGSQAEAVPTAGFGITVFDTIIWDADNLANLVTLPTYGGIEFTPVSEILNVVGL